MGGPASAAALSPTLAAAASARGRPSSSSSSSTGRSTTGGHGNHSSPAPPSRGAFFATRRSLRPQCRPRRTSPAAAAGGDCGLEPESGRGGVRGGEAGPREERRRVFETTSAGGVGGAEMLRACLPGLLAGAGVLVATGSARAAGKSNIDRNPPEEGYLREYVDKDDPDLGPADDVDTGGEWTTEENALWSEGEEFEGLHGRSNERVVPDDAPLRVPPEDYTQPYYFAPGEEVVPQKYLPEKDPSKVAQARIYVERAPPRSFEERQRAAMVLASFPTPWDSSRKGELAYGEFLTMLENNDILSADITYNRRKINVVTKDNVKYVVHNPGDPTLLDRLIVFTPHFTVKGENWAAAVIGSLTNVLGPLTSLFLAGYLYRAFKSQLGTDLDEFSKSTAKLTQSTTTFKDIAGIDAAQKEVQEVIMFLKDADKYSKLGAKLPTGVLLVGAPGTGKTLLARAIAGEAGVPFYSCSASEFVEMFVGIGAARVRDMFEIARKKSPCVIFIDEFDSIGQARGMNPGAGDEREQTINQLLTELDGFGKNKGVVVLAATNRPEVLDEALIRPGRFDRRIVLSKPTVDGRREILKVHTRELRLATDVSLQKLALRTSGMTGADLANLANEAACNAVREKDALVKIDRKNKQIVQFITMAHFTDALDTILYGRVREDLISSPHKQRLMAYHEVGHALTGILTRDFDKVERVSIVPRQGPASGTTTFEPDETIMRTGIMTRTYLEDALMVTMAGRTCEEIIFGRMDLSTTGCPDIEKVTQVARHMVLRMGMSPEIGLVSLGVAQEPLMYLGNDMPLDKFGSIAVEDLSREMALKVDREIMRITNDMADRARGILLQHLPLVHELADWLLRVQTIDGEDLYTWLDEREKQGKVHRFTTPHTPSPVVERAMKEMDAAVAEGRFDLENYLTGEGKLPVIGASARDQSKKSLNEVYMAFYDGPYTDGAYTQDFHRAMKNMRARKAQENPKRNMQGRG